MGVRILSDLQVKRESFTEVRPEKIKERRSLFLSNIDQIFVGRILNSLYCFSAYPAIPFDAIVSLTTQALSKILVPYDFMCGRLAFNSEQGRFEIDCNAAGVPFAICTSPLSLIELGDIDYSNAAFNQLCFLPHSAKRTPEDQPLLSFQITQFRCGGFIVGITTSHCLMDRISLDDFIKNFSYLVVKGELAFIPVINRTRLMARCPLQIEYKHEEDIESSAILLLNKPSLPIRPNNYEFRVISLSGKFVEVLKMKAKNGGVKHCTRFMATLAHLWRARTTAIGNMNSEDVSTVQFVVNIRSKFKHPLPREFVGNAILTAYAKATSRELQDQPFCEIVKKLQEGLDRITDNYVRSRIDIMELQNRVMCLENGFLVTSWLHMGGDLELGKGIKSVRGGLMIERWAQSVVFMADPKDEAGIMMHIALEPRHMARFEKLIQMSNIN
ncbi:hypothetical protein SUGI_0254580 [Cryptomeria japonica]|uniref:acyltransferase GLAUCE-like n=1 Tax=Cryptomeria japonica TaxID=3369 RepID=UPI002408C0E5|nr:acyltransferase GLAUCE-like [Cryptomeria japonica]GLJ15506.1 hypothetical protein SUGI_0254580 [Cryptomeria japonica]